jgi:hypothetical protein
MPMGILIEEGNSYEPAKANLLLPSFYPSNSKEKLNKMKILYSWNNNARVDCLTGSYPNPVNSNLS